MTFCYFSSVTRDFSLFPLRPVTFHYFLCDLCLFMIFPLWPVTFTISPLHVATNKRKLIWRRAYHTLRMVFLQDHSGLHTVSTWPVLFFAYFEKNIKEKSSKRRNELSYV